MQLQIVKEKKNEGTDVIKKIKRLYKEFDFTAGDLKGKPTEGQKMI